MQRRSFRLSALAATITAVAAFATQAATSPGTDATLSPLAWTVSHGEATEFHDATARDTMASREQVKSDLLQARTAGRLADTGEGGATERVLAQREAYVHSEHERLVALHATPVEPDALDAMIAAMAERDAWAEASYALAPEDAWMSLPSNEDSFATTAGISALDAGWTYDPAVG
jgi:hypothetical protein